MKLSVIRRVSGRLPLHTPDYSIIVLLQESDFAQIIAQIIVKTKSRRKSGYFEYAFFSVSQFIAEIFVQMTYLQNVMSWEPAR